MNLFLPEVVRKLQDFYGDLLGSRDSFPNIYSHLQALADRMWEGVREGNEFVFKEIANYHRDHLGRSNEQLAALGLGEADCRQAVANEYGFSRWTQLERLVYPYNLEYERAVDSLLAGDMAGLQKRISATPALLQGRSQYGHGASLLHYAVCNGVEIWRQQVPMNLVEEVTFLLGCGAEPNARMKVYGGEYTAAELLLSSLHPRNAGIFEELRHLMET